MSAETQAVAQQWLHYAEGDLLSAKVLAASNAFRQEMPAIWPNNARKKH